MSTTFERKKFLSTAPQKSTETLIYNQNQKTLILLVINMDNNN